MKLKSLKYVAAILVLSLIVQPVLAAPIASKTATDSRATDLVAAQSRFGTDRIASALAQEGLDASQIEARLAALSTPDVITLTQNPAQIKSAGISMSKRMWTAVGIGAGALVVGGLALKQKDDGEDEDGVED